MLSLKLKLGTERLILLNDKEKQLIEIEPIRWELPTLLIRQSMYSTEDAGDSRIVKLQTVHEAEWYLDKWVIFPLLGQVSVRYETAGYCRMTISAPSETKVRIGGAQNA